jgi:hypothetical protein
LLTKSTLKNDLRVYSDEACTNMDLFAGELGIAGTTVERVLTIRNEGKHVADKIMLQASPDYVIIALAPVKLQPGEKAPLIVKVALPLDLEASPVITVKGDYLELLPPGPS